ncbi:MAG: crotonase/enoyl-CoA hydratase family protein [Betaproteobacteria bacterium]|nr:crotonase/enoyl-CoA hydratase family protein [Betaproteobacteria bacterium]
MVRIEKQDRVWTVIHSRPEARNAMDPESAAALAAAFLAFDRDPEAAVAVLWGEGGAFCSGFDLKHAASLAGEPRPLEALAYPLDERAAPDGQLPRGPMGPTRLELDKPVIAAIAGPAVAGGFELALWCDLRVMEQSAYFGVYCRRWGVPLVDGGTVRLPRLVGAGRAMEIILTGRKVSSEEAQRIGACEQVVPDGRSREHAEAMAHAIARFPQACLRADRRSVRMQEGLPLREAMRREWYNGLPAFVAEGAAGAARFASGKGRHGDFDAL